MTGVTLIDSSLQEVDEEQEQVSSDEGALPVVVVPDAPPSLIEGRMGSRLDTSNSNTTQNNPSPTSSQYMPENNHSFLKLSGSAMPMKLGARRSSEAYRDINSEIEEILNITESPKREKTTTNGEEEEVASREGHTETDEEEEDEDPVGEDEEDDADFEETEGEGRSDESFLNTDNLFQVASRDRSRSKGMFDFECEIAF